ncbi:MULTISPECIES: DUF6262 family protein [Peribacillus]|uniref:DUF6262 family protein n=1 Tax=Peribacillus castrilensis TaxID=2897690 RepID=A0AAW9NFU7_9BACI|nr:DUF6262 family protein [Peribacillus frigoritolerans]MEC0274448.1 DUF6262 family protein [Peribacillus castrilensis]TFH58362.1 transposase [Peribacillus frigoritolerans]
MANVNPNTKGLKTYALQKKINTKERVDEALKKMYKENMRINFNSVSKVAKVSKAFLYKELEYRNKIESFRKEQEGIKSLNHYKKSVSETSKDVIIEALKNKISELNQKIRELELENKQLKETRKVELGNIYDKI